MFLAFLHLTFHTNSTFEQETIGKAFDLKFNEQYLPDENNQKHMTGPTSQRSVHMQVVNWSYMMFWNQIDLNGIQIPSVCG